MRDAGDEFEAFETAGNLRFRYGNIGDQVEWTSYTFGLDEWHYFTFTWDDSSGAEIYMDGVRRANVSATWTGMTPAGSMFIGDGDFVDGEFQGTLDEVQIWNRVLNASEINASYSNSIYALEGNFTDLVDGNYTWTASVVDAAGNLVSTDEQVFVVDTLIPTVDFIDNTRANNTFTGDNHSFVNVSSSDLTDHSVFVDFNKSLVGWWRFEDSDGGTTANDTSSFGNDGTLTNFGCTDLNCNLTGGTGSTGSGWTSAGRRGKGLVFDGENDFINIDAVLTNNLATTTAGTWTAWIKPSNAAASGFESFITFGDTNVNEYLVFGVRTDPSNVLRFQAFDAGTEQWTLDVDTAPFSDDTWTFIAVAHDGVEAVLYVDGVEVAQTFVVSTDKTAWFNALTELDNGRIGSFNTNGAGEASHFNGTLDEVKVWNRALSALEVNSSFNAGKYQFEANFTGLIDGNYSYDALVVDSAGNINITANRTVVIDTTSASVTFVAPTVANNSRHNNVNE